MPSQRHFPALEVLKHVVDGAGDFYDHAGSLQPEEYLFLSFQHAGCSALGADDLGLREAPGAGFQLDAEDAGTVSYGRDDEDIRQPPFYAGADECGGLLGESLVAPMAAENQNAGGNNRRSRASAQAYWMSRSGATGWVRRKAGAVNG